MNNDDPNAPLGQNSSPDDSLGRAANRYVTFQIVSAIIGGITFLIFLFAVILPGINHVNQGFNQTQGLNQTQGFPQAGPPMGGGTTTYTMNGHPATPEEQKSIDAAINQSHASGQPPK